MAQASATRIDPVHTGNIGREAWIRSRHAEAVGALEEQGFAPTDAWAMASALVAQWALEIGWGRSEWNYALGNIRAFHCGLYHVLSNGYDYCAYRSLPEAVRAQIELLRAPRYARSWEILSTSHDGHAFYDQVMRDGWNPWKAEDLATYDDTYARVLRTMGPPPQEAPQTTSWLGLAVVTAALAGAVWLWRRG